MSSIRLACLRLHTNMAGINGVVAAVARGIIAMATGPAQISGMQADIKALTVQVAKMHGDIREIRGYLRGRAEPRG